MEEFKDLVNYNITAKVKLGNKSSKLTIKVKHKNLKETAIYKFGKIKEFDYWNTIMVYGIVYDINLFIDERTTLALYLLKDGNTDPDKYYMIDLRVIRDE